MNLIEVVILVGAQCLSPMEQGPGLTVIGKVPCAVLIRQDPQTSDIDIVPPSAATDPQVIAMLVKPKPGNAISKMDRLPVTAADDITGSVTKPPPRIVPASGAVEPPDTARKAKPAPGKKQVAAARPSQTGRRDACGSYRAVWYTSKTGHRKYRCVKRA